MLSVDDRGARYPVRVDPFVQQGEITPSDGATLESFGSSVAVQGGTLVVGAPGHVDGGNSDEGAAYVFTAGANGWADPTQIAELTPAGGNASEQFGLSVGFLAPRSWSPPPA